MKDNFSIQSAGYALYRPHYPPELFDYIVQFVKDRQLAWDCGTGNGQSAKILSRYFDKVIATDISASQIEKAHQSPNISYAIEPAEKTGIASNSTDLVTVAQAIHWFDFERFYAEVNRVGKPGSHIAVWTYSLLSISPRIDELIHHYHYHILGAYWDAERKYVDEEYKTIPFPFEEIPSPRFEIKVNWSLDELSGYFNTWSALQKFITAEGYSPVPALITAIQPYWGSSEKKEIVFPVHLRLGRK